MDFDYNKITEIYQKARKFGHDEVIFQKESGDYLIISFQNKTLFVFNDNFPGPKRYFNHNMPILTFDQFEADLVRMKIPVPERNAEYQLTNNQHTSNQ